MFDWESYEERFRTAAAEAASRRHFDPEYADRCLHYARGLFDRALPIIYDYAHFCRLVGYNSTFVLAAANKPRRFYREFSIPKRSGGQRAIAEPLPSLKEIQRWILDNVLAPVPIHRYAKAFVKGRSIRENARFHVNQQKVLCLDVEDFFGSIKTGRVIGLFRRLGYCRGVATLLGNLCSLQGSLPQGAPTSPALSNLISVGIDRRLSGYARRLGIRYTRYADDLTFSGQFDEGRLVLFVQTVLSADGLRLNDSKTRLMERHQRQETTGIVVNQRLQVPRKLRRQLRQVSYYVEQFGLDSHLLRTGTLRANARSHLLGLANHVLFVNPEDRDALRLISVLTGVGPGRLPES